MKIAGLVVSVVLLAAGAPAQTRDAATWAANLSTDYGLSPNITYQTVGGVDLKLDVYAPRYLRGPNSVVVYYHGGGGVGGGREYTVLRLMPWMEMGFTVVRSGLPAILSTRRCRSRRSPPPCRAAPYQAHEA